MEEEDRQRRCCQSKILPSEKMSSAAMGGGLWNAGEEELKIIVIITIVVVIDVAGIIVDSDGDSGDPLRGVIVLDLDDLLLLLFLSPSFLYSCFFFSFFVWLGIELD